MGLIGDELKGEIENFEPWVDYYKFSDMESSMMCYVTIHVSLLSLVWPKTEIFDTWQGWVGVCKCKNGWTRGETNSDSKVKKRS